MAAGRSAAFWRTIAHLATDPRNELVILIDEPHKDSFRPDSSGSRLHTPHRPGDSARRWQRPVADIIGVRHVPGGATRQRGGEAVRRGAGFSPPHQWRFSSNRDATSPLAGEMKREATFHSGSTIGRHPSAARRRLKTTRLRGLGSCPRPSISDCRPFILTRALGRSIARPRAPGKDCLCCLSGSGFQGGHQRARAIAASKGAIRPKLVRAFFQ